jgi:hypothetical protein
MRRAELALATRRHGQYGEVAARLRRRRRRVAEEVGLCAATSRRRRARGRLFPGRAQACGTKDGEQRRAPQPGRVEYALDHLDARQGESLCVQMPREWTDTTGLAAGCVSECCAWRIKADGREHGLGAGM